MSELQNNKYGNVLDLHKLYSIKTGLCFKMCKVLAQVELPYVWGGTVFVTFL